MWNLKNSTNEPVYKTETGSKLVSETKVRKVNSSYDAFTQPHLTVSQLCLKKCFDTATDKVCAVTAKAVFTKTYTNCRIKTGKECSCNV